MASEGMGGHPGRLARGIGFVLAAGLALWLVRPPPRFSQERSTAILDRHGRLLGAGIARDGQWRFPEADSVPAKFRLAAIAAEDHRFAIHPGVDPFAVTRALRDNFRPHRRVQGASTLTMQVARLLRRDRGIAPRRSLVAKVSESALAMRLELWHRKSTILGLWSANAPFGGNVVGLDAAAWRWYGTPPEDLTWGQCATLASLPNAPSRLLGTSQGRTALAQRRDAVLMRLLQSGHLDSTELSLARNEPLPDKPRPLPRLARHALATVDRVSPGSRWTTTLDLDLQSEIERLARAQLADLSLQDVTGLAVLVVEVPGGDSLPLVRAWIGDAGPQSVDLALAPRSSASTLKPFLYGLLMDQGRILPKQWLLDIPSRWGDYRPLNASGTFEGAVPADLALSRSLNVPWVRELHGIGVESFLGVLRRAGLAHLHRDAEGYGLSLVLGGAETSLLELATAYAALARGGVASTFSLARSGTKALTLGGPPAEGQPPPRTVQEADAAVDRSMLIRPAPRRVLSPEASWLVLDALRKPGRIEEEVAWKAFAGARPLAWKTGTSFGFRDAWTVSVRPRWVVAVWAGDPGGGGRPGLWGSTAAAPLVFRIQPLLPSSPHAWFLPPPGLVSVEVCPTTGWRRSEVCPSGSSVIAPPSGRTAPVDPWHQRRPFEASGTFRVHSECEDPHRTIQNPVLELPAAVEALLREHDPSALPTAPPWRDGCVPSGTNDAIQILLPENSSTVVLPRDIDGSVQKLAIQASHRRAEAPIRCFLDHEDLGVSQRFRTFLVQPDPGPHVVLCQDEEGSRATARFQVRWTERALEQRRSDMR